MNVGTKSVLFGAHQFILHPIFVLWAWRVIYGKWPQFHQLCAIVTHDLGYWGKPNMDGPEGQEHPEVAAEWWRKHFGRGCIFQHWAIADERCIDHDLKFGEKVAREVLGHSRFHVAKHNMKLSMLYRPDKLATALYPRWLYLLMANLSGEIHEYMAHYQQGHYTGEKTHHATQTAWLIEVQAQMALLGIQGNDNKILKKQMESGGDV